MSFSSPFGSTAGSDGFALPGQRRADEASDADVVLLTGVPRVDLLPAAVAHAERLRRLQLGLAGAAALVLLGCVGATLLAGAQVGRAEEALAVEQARTAQLQAEQARYAEVPLLRSQEELLTTARSTALADDVLWYRYTAHLSNVLPPDLHLTSLTLQLADAGAPDAAAAPDATGAAATTAGVPAVGSMTLSLEGRTVPDTADLLDVLSGTPGLQGAWADSTTAAAEGAGTTVQARAELSTDALSRRFDATATDATDASDATAADATSPTEGDQPAAAGTTTGTEG